MCHPHGMSQKTSDLGQETKKWLGMWISNQLPAFWTPDTSYFNNMLQCGTPQKKTSRPHPQYCNRWLVPSQMDPGLAGLPVRLCSPSAGLSKPVEAAEFSNVCYMYIYKYNTHILYNNKTCTYIYIDETYIYIDTNKTIFCRSHLVLETAAPWVCRFSPLGSQPFCSSHLSKERAI